MVSKSKSRSRKRYKHATPCKPYGNSRRKGRDGRRVSAWNNFAGKMRKEGKSFKEASREWRKRKCAQKVNKTRSKSRSKSRSKKGKK